MDSQAQQQAIRDLGVNPQDIAKHYKHLLDKDTELKNLDKTATRNTTIMGWASFGAALLGTIKIREKIAKGNKLIQGFGIAIASFTSGYIGTFLGTRIFSEGIRNEAKAMDLDARHSLERELAIIFENRERAGTDPATAVVPQVKAATQNIAPRSASFVAQAAADKAAEAVTGQQRA